MGSATAITPTLPVPMKGPAFLVSHGGEEFPSLELVLEGEGVRMIVEGKTNIKNGITTTNFATTPDVPVSSITVNLPTGPHSALTTVTSTPTCARRSCDADDHHRPERQGRQTEHDDRPTGCGVQIVGHKVVGNTRYLTRRRPSPPGASAAAARASKPAQSNLSGPSKATTLRSRSRAVGRSRRSRSR